MTEKQDPRATQDRIQPDPRRASPVQEDPDPESAEELVRLVIEIDDPTPEEAGYGHGV